MRHTATLLAAATIALAGCGPLVTRADLTANQPVLDITVEAPLGPTYRRVANLTRDCFSRSGWLFDSAADSVHSDYFEAEGFGEISGHTAAPTWTMVGWLVELRRVSPESTRARLWKRVGAFTDPQHTWWRGVLSGSITACEM